MRMTTYIDDHAEKFSYNSSGIIPALQDPGDIDNIAPSDMLDGSASVASSLAVLPLVNDNLTSKPARQLYPERSGSSQGRGRNTQKQVNDPRLREGKYLKVNDTNAVETPETLKKIKKPTKSPSRKIRQHISLEEKIVKNLKSKKEVDVSEPRRKQEAQMRAIQKTYNEDDEAGSREKETQLWKKTQNTSTITEPAVQMFKLHHYTTAAEVSQRKSFTEIQLTYTKPKQSDPTCEDKLNPDLSLSGDEIDS